MVKANMPGHRQPPGEREGPGQAHDRLLLRADLRRRRLDGKGRRIGVPAHALERRGLPGGAPAPARERAFPVLSTPSTHRGLRGPIDRGAERLTYRRRHPQPVPVRAGGPGRALLHSRLARICARRASRGSSRRSPSPCCGRCGTSCRPLRVGGAAVDLSPIIVWVVILILRAARCRHRATASASTQSPGDRPIPSRDMDLSAKVLREVEFRDRLRGYDTDEVDEFLEKVAVAVDEMQEKMRQLAYPGRARRAVGLRSGGRRGRRQHPPDARPRAADG